MYERFTQRARKVMQLANQQAQSFNHQYLGTEHILLGLIQEGTGVGAHVLRQFGVLQDFRQAVHDRVESGPEMITMGNHRRTN